MPNMTGSTIDKVLDIKVNYHEAVKKMGDWQSIIDKCNSAIKSLRDEQEAWNKKLQQGAITQAQYDLEMEKNLQQLAAVDTQLKMTSKSYSTTREQILRQIKAEQAQEKSLESLRANLAYLQTTYERLTESERKNAIGKDIVKEMGLTEKAIKAVTDELAKNELKYTTAAGSLERLRGELKLFKDAYESLSERARNGKRGQNLLDKIVSTENKIGDIEKEIKAAHEVKEAWIGSLEQIKNKITELRETYNGLSKSDREGPEGAKIANSIAKLTEQQALGEKTIKDAVQSRKQAGDSLSALREQIKSLRTEYEHLSESERNGSKGNTLIKQIVTLGAEVKESDERFKQMAKSMTTVSGSIDAMKAHVAELKKEFNSLSSSGRTSAKAENIAIAEKELADAENMIKKAEIEQKAQGDSLDAIRAKIKLLTNEYNSLNTTQRNIQSNGILDQLRALNEELQKGEDKLKQATKAQNNNTTSLEGMRARIAEIRKEYAQLDGSGRSSFDFNEFSLLTAAVKKAENAMKQSVREFEASGTSIDALKARLSLLKEAYNGLSESQRSTSDLPKKIAETGEQIRLADKAIKDAQLDVKATLPGIEGLRAKLEQAKQAYEADPIGRNATAFAQIKVQVEEYDKMLERAIVREKAHSGSLDGVRAKLSSLKNLYGSMTETTRKGSPGQTVLGEYAKAAVEIENAEKAMKQAVIEEKAQGDSLSALRNQLILAKEQFENLTRSERENASIGGTLLTNIQNLAQEIRKADDAMRNATDKGNVRKSSLQGIRGTLRDLKNSFIELDEVQRNGAVGKSMIERIGKLTQQIKSADEATRQAMLRAKENASATGSLAQLRARLSQLNYEFDNMSRAARNGSKGISMLSEIRNVTNEIKEAEKATQRFYRNVGNYKDAISGLTQMTSGFKTLGGIITQIMGGLSFGAFANNMVHVAKDFEDGMARVRAVANPLQSEFKQLRDRAIELGSTTRYTATEVSSGMEEMARKGFNTKETLEAILPTLQLAQANVVSLAEAAQVSSSTLRAFGMDVSNLTHVNDVLSSTCSHSATNLELMGEAMKTAGPVAAIFISETRDANTVLRETSSLIGGLANVGMTGSDAGTGVKQLMMALTAANNTDNRKSILAKYGLEIDELKLKTEGLIPTLKKMKEAGLGENLNDLTLFAGKYASPRLAQIINNIDQVVALNETLEKSIGENARMFEQSLGNTSNSIYMLQSAWQSFMINVYDSSSKFVTGPIDGITEALKFLGTNISLVGQLLVSVMAGISFAPVVKKFKDTFLPEFKKFQETNTAIINELKNDLKDYSSKLSEELSKPLQDQDFAFQDFLDDAIDKTKDAISKAEGRLGKFSGFFKATMAGLKASAKALWATLKAAFMSFLPILAVTAFVEVGTAIWNWATGVSETQKRIDELNASLKKGVHNETIAQLEYIKKKLTEIEEKRIKADADIKTQNGLIAKANGLLGTTYKTYGEINKALATQIKRLQESARAQAFMNSYAKAYQDMIDIGARNGVSADDMSSPEKIYTALAKKWNKLTLGEQGWDSIVTFFGGDETMASDFKKWQGARNIMSFIEKTRSPEEIAEAIGGRDKMNIDLTKSGGFNGQNAIVDKTAIKEAENFGKSLLNAIKKYSDQTDSLVTSTVEHSFERMTSKAHDEFVKIERDIDTYEKSIATKRAKYAKSGNAEMLKLLKTLDETIANLRKANKEKEEYELYKISKERLDQELANEKDYFDAIDKLYKSRISSRKEYSEIELKDVDNEHATRLKLAKQAFANETTLREKEHAQQMSANRTKFVSGGFGDLNAEYGRDDKKALDDYYKKKAEIEAKYADNPDLRDAELEALNDSFKAYLSYANMKEMYEVQYNENEVERERQHKKNLLEIDKEYYQTKLDRALLATQNYFEQQSLAYQDEIAMQGQHGYNLQNMKEQDWQRLQSRIGEQEAFEIQEDWQKYQLELQNFNAHKDELYRTSEEKQAREIELKKKGEEIHIKSNKAIQKSDETRLEAATTVMGGVIQLMEALGEENKGMAKLAKALALAQIAIDTGKAISSTIAQASTVMYPANLPIIAGGIATVLSNMATAISTVKSAKFATGAVNIGGAGTTTSDSIPARISRGESVINAKATQMFEPLLIAMNNIGNGVALPRNNRLVQPDQMAELREAFIEATREIRPVVDVREITSTQNRVEVIQNLDSF